MSPDGRYLITHYLINQDKNSGSIVGREDQGVVRLYDQASGKLLLEHFGTQAVSSPGGKRLAVRGYSQRDRSEPLEILEIESGKVIQTIVPPQEQEAAGRRGFGVQGGRGIRGSSGGASAGRPLAFTPDGKSLIVLDGQETLSLWDVATAKQTKTWSLTENGIVEKQNQNTGSSRDSVYTVAVSPDGSQIAFGLTRREIDAGRYQWFGRLVVAEATTGKILFQNDWKPDYVGKLAFSPDSKLLAMDAGLRTIRVWDTAAGRVVKQFEGHRGRIRSLAFSPDGKRLASASDDSTALIWDVAK